MGCTNSSESMRTPSQDLYVQSTNSNGSDPDWENRLFALTGDPEHIVNMASLVVGQEVGGYTTGDTVYLLNPPDLSLVGAPGTVVSLSTMDGVGLVYVFVKPDRTVRAPLSEVSRAPLSDLNCALKPGQEVVYGGPLREVPKAEKIQYLDKDAGLSTDGVTGVCPRMVRRPSGGMRRMPDILLPGLRGTICGYSLNAKGSDADLGHGRMDKLRVVMKFERHKSILLHVLVEEMFPKRGHRSRVVTVEKGVAIEPKKEAVKDKEAEPPAPAQLDVPSLMRAAHAKAGATEMPLGHRASSKEVVNKVATASSSRGDTMERAVTEPTGPVVSKHSTTKSMFRRPSQGARAVHRRSTVE